jgi:hypothetical protein
VAAAAVAAASQGTQIAGNRSVILAM